MRLTVALLLAALAATAHAATHAIEGRIVGITDGDTMTMLDADHHQHKIPLDGIDTPESKQPFGMASKRHLSDLAFNREAVAECHKIDRYRREICRLLVGGVDVCLVQIRAGMARHFKKYAKEQTRLHREQYASAELEARAEQRGAYGNSESHVRGWHGLCA